MKILGRWPNGELFGYIDSFYILNLSNLSSNLKSSLSKSSDQKKVYQNQISISLGCIA